MGKPNLDRARELALEIIEDPEYQECLRKRAIAGTLDPVIEEMLLFYGFAPKKPSNNLRLIKRR